MDGIKGRSDYDGKNRRQDKGRSFFMTSGMEFGYDEAQILMYKWKMLKCSVVIYY